MRGQNFGGEHGQGLPVDRERDIVGVAVEQAAAGRRLETADVLAYRRLAQASPPRGFREGAGLGDGQEGHELVGIVGRAHRKS